MAKDGATASTASPVAIWATVVLMALLFAFSMIDRVVLSIVIAPVKADLQLSDAQFGLAQGAAIALFYLIMALPFGWAADRFDRRIVLFIGITTWSLASAACALVRNFPELFAARAMVGAGEASLGPAGYPLIAGLVGRKRLALAMMIFVLGGVTGNGLGQLIGGPLFGYFSALGETIYIWPLGELTPWRAVFIVTGVPGLLLALLVLIVPRGPRVAQKPIAGSNRKDCHTGSFVTYLSQRARYFLAVICGIGFQNAAIFAVILWNAAFVGRIHGWTPGEIGAVFGGILVTTSAMSIMVHSWCMSALFEKGHKDIHLKWQGGASVLAVPCVMLTYLTSSIELTYVGFAIYSVALGGALVAGPTILQLATPAEFRGRMNAVYVIIGSLLGTALGPALVGFVTDWVLRDEMLVGTAIAICCVCFNIAAIICFTIGVPLARDVMRESELVEAE